MADYDVSAHYGVLVPDPLHPISIMEYQSYTNKLEISGSVWTPAGGNLLSSLTWNEFASAGALRGYTARNQYINNTNALWIADVGGGYIGVVGLSTLNMDNPYINGYNIFVSPNRSINNIYTFGGLTMTFSGTQAEKSGACFIGIYRDSRPDVDHDVLHICCAARNNYTIEEMKQMSDNGSRVYFLGQVELKDSSTKIVGVKVADTSKEGGGGGDYDTTNTTTDFPSVPSLDLIGTGIVNVWNPSSYDLKLLNQWLWRDTTIFDDAKKLVDSPLSLIVSLKMIPVGVSRGEESHFCLAGQDSAINMYPVSSQFITVDCGSVAINEYFGSALDYGAYTKIRIFLPFVGIKDLSPDDCMGGALALKYNVDVVTGDCVACLKCTRANLSNVLYTYGGNLAYDVPLTSLNYSGKNKADLANAMGVIGGVMSQNPAGVISSAMGIMTNKPNFERASDLKGNTGFLGNKQPFIVLERPIQSLPDNAGRYYGYPSNITATLGTLAGYTEVQNIIETNIHCLDEELAEIDTLLKEGVYL